VGTSDDGMVGRWDLVTDPSVLCPRELSVMLSARFLFAISPLSTSIYKNFEILLDTR